MRITHRETPVADRRLFFSFLLLMLWLPLPWASNRPWAWAIMEVWALTLLAFWIIAFVRGKVTVSVAFLKAKPVLILFAIWLLYLLLQITPLPYFWVAILSPEAAHMHALPVGDRGLPESITLSVDAHASAVFLLKSLAYAAIFVLTMLLVNRRGRMQQLAGALVLSGLFQAAYGSVMTLSGLEYGFFDKKQNLGVATGTFVNPNHLAGYLVMILAVGIGLMIARFEAGGEFTWRQRLRNLVRLMLSAKVRLRLYLAVMVIALVLTHSRMGNTAFFASMMIAGVIGLLLFKHAARPTLILLGSLIIIDIFIVGSWFGIEQVVERLEQTSVASESRDEVGSDTLELWKDYKWVGAGAGSFYSVFPRYHEGDVQSFYDHAHNDYLQFLAETGIVGLGILGLIVILSLGSALKAQYRRRDPLMRGMAFASVMGITAILIHSTVDFNLQIPANAATFIVLLALAWLSPHLRDRDVIRR